MNYNKNRVIIIFGISDVGKTTLCKELEKISLRRNTIKLMWYGGWYKLRKYIAEYFKKQNMDIGNIEYVEDLFEPEYIKIFYDAYLYAIEKTLHQKQKNVDFVLFDSHVFHPLTQIYNQTNFVYLPLSPLNLIRNLKPSLIIFLTDRDKNIFERRLNSEKPIALRTKDLNQIKVENMLEFCGACSLSLILNIPIIYYKMRYYTDIDEMAAHLLELIETWWRHFRCPSVQEEVI